MDQIKQQLDMLAELSDEQVTELKSAIVGEFENVEKEDPTPQTVDAMTTLADMLDTVRSEVSRRETQAQELASRAEEAAMRVKGQEDVPAEGTPEEEVTEAPEEEAKETPEEEMPAAPAAEEKKKNPFAEASTAVEEASELSTEEPAITETPAAEEAPAPVAEETAAPVEETAPAAEPEAISASGEEEVTTPTEETIEAPIVQEDQEAPVTAAVNEPEASNEVIEAPADRRPSIQASAATVAITAGADIPGYTAGTTMDSMKDVAEAMSKRIHTLRRVNGGDGEQHIVASITTQYPEARTLSTDAESNWNKIQAVTGPEALVASGGHQAPFEVKYDIFGIGTAVRPVRDSLPRFQADRGGIRYIVPPVLADYDGAVGIWTSATDTTPEGSTKASLTVSAASETTVATDAVTLQLQFGNLLTRAYPELIARHNELGLIQHAREAEQNLLSKIGTASTAVTSSSLIGVGRDFLVQIGRAAAAYRSRHRLEADAPLRVIFPAWVKDAMVADLTLTMPGDNTLNASAEIEGYLASRNVNVTYTIDGNVFGAQSAAAMLEFPDTFVWYIFAEGTFVFLDGGTLDVGIIRDSTLVGTNDYKMFLETFEGIAKVGIESLKVTSTINVNGVAAALRDTTGGASAAAIEY